MTWPSLFRVRFGLWVAGLLLAALAVFGAVVYLSMERGLLSAVDDSLRLSASQILSVVEYEDGRLSYGEVLPAETSGVGPIGRALTMRVLDPGGLHVQAFGEYKDWPVSAASLAAANEGQTLFETAPNAAAGTRVRFYTAPIVQQGRVLGAVQVALDLGDVQFTLRRLLQALLLGGPVLVLAAALGGYALAARALAPVDHMTRTVRRIADGTDLSARLSLPVTNDEVGRLASTFDLMLARLGDAFRRERQFTADASHELRTPLAAMQAILSVIRKERRTVEDYEQALADLNDEADRLTALVEDLLALARHEGPDAAVAEPVAMADLLDDITSSLAPLADAKGLNLSCRVPADLCVRGDRDQLIRLFVNLLDNAIKYTEHGGVTVQGQAEGAWVAVTIDDTGVGIAAEHLPHLFDRFYRVEAARSSRGMGLGLAIALRIAEAHHGRIRVESQVGRGTHFRVELPRERQGQGPAAR